MPETLRTLEDTLALMARYGGTKWPNPWWPNGNSNYDDCAAAVSWALFGLNSSNNPFYSYVSQIQNYFSGLGRRTWGHSGIRRGDVLAFSWTQDPSSFDHTEIALGPVSPAGLITSRGTNSNPGDDMRDRTRSAAYVVSFARPDFAGTSIAVDVKSTALTPEQEEDEMELNALQNHDNSVGIIGSDGLLTILRNDNEWQSYLRLGIVKKQPDGTYTLRQSDGTVWNALSAVTARTRVAQTSTDPKAIAAALAPLLVSPILTAIQKSGVTLTQAQVEAAAEEALHDFFADAVS